MGRSTLTLLAMMQVMGCKPDLGKQKAKRTQQSPTRTSGVSLPSWVKQRSGDFAVVDCAKPDFVRKGDPACEIQAWARDLKGCRVKHMFTHALKSYRHIRQEWLDSSKARFQVGVTVCRGRTGCSATSSKLLCIDVKNQLVYEIDDASHFFGALRGKRVESYSP